MLQLNDYECLNCANVEEHYVNIEEQVFCSKCGGISKKLFTGMRFELKYNPKTDMCSWGNEGYSSSQYWKDVKKAKEDGHKVKGANEL